jgi:hypothetical protein
MPDFESLAKGHDAVRYQHRLTENSVYKWASVLYSYDWPWNGSWSACWIKFVSILLQCWQNLTFLTHGLFVCLFVVHLTMLFQHLRLYSFDLYSILIRLSSSSEAGETRARNMAAEFCRRAPIVFVGFFNMPQIYDMGPTALLPLRRKSCYGFYHP